MACGLLLLACGCASQSSDNGIASESPARALARAQAAAADAATVHVSGALAGPNRPLTVGLELVRGEGGRGTIAVGDARADLNQVDGWIYVKPSPLLLRRMVGPAAASRLAGRWLKAPADHGPLAPLASLTDLRTVLHEALSADQGRVTTEVGGAGPLQLTLISRPALKIDGTRKVAGHRAVALEDPSTGARLYISATGTPYPLALVEPGRSGGRLTFDRWNQPVVLQAPANPLNIKAVFSLKGL